MRLSIVLKKYNKIISAAKNATKHARTPRRQTPHTGIKGSIRTAKRDKKITTKNKNIHYYNKKLVCTLIYMITNHKSERHKINEKN